MAWQIESASDDFSAETQNTPDDIDIAPKLWPHRGQAKLSLCMTNPTVHRFAAKVCELAVRTVADHERDCQSRWVAVALVAKKMDCGPQTQHDQVK